MRAKIDAAAEGSPEKVKATADLDALNAAVERISGEFDENALQNNDSFDFEGKPVATNA